MPPSLFNRSVAAALLVAGFAAGCSTAQTALREDRPTAEWLAVQGRQGLKIKEQIRFGPYATDRIDRSWTRGPGLAVGPLDWQKRRQTFAFTLQEEGAEAWLVDCSARLRRTSIDVGVGEVEAGNRSALACTLRAAGAEGPEAHLELDETRERPLAGTLHHAGQTWRVDGTDDVAGGLRMRGTTTGYALAHGGTVRAVVEVLNDGAVWLDPALARADRGLLAATAAVLLLAEDLRAHLAA